MEKLAKGIIRKCQATITDLIRTTHHTEVIHPNHLMTKAKWQTATETLTYTEHKMQMGKSMK